MASAIFWPTQLTYQSRPTVNLFNFCVFHLILIRFGLGANFGLKRTWNKLKNYLGIMSAEGRPQESRTLADGWLTDSSSPLSSLLCFTILSSAPALFLPCSCPAPGPAHPSLAAFIIIISTLRLFSARREPPFMVCICLYICMFKICDDFSNKTTERELWTTPFLLVPAQTFQLSIQQLTPIIWNEECSWLNLFYLPLVIKLTVYTITSFFLELR